MKYIKTMKCNSCSYIINQSIADTGYPRNLSHDRYNTYCRNCDRRVYAVTVVEYVPEGTIAVDHTIENTI